MPVRENRHTFLCVHRSSILHNNIYNTKTPTAKLHRFLENLKNRQKNLKIELKMRNIFLEFMIFLCSFAVDMFFNKV